MAKALTVSTGGNFWSIMEVDVHEILMLPMPSTTSTITVRSTSIYGAPSQDFLGTEYSEEVHHSITIAFSWRHSVTAQLIHDYIGRLFSWETQQGIKGPTWAPWPDT